MSTRIGALWKKIDNEGNAYLTGNIKTECGICVPAHSQMQVSLRKNDKKVEGDNRPDFHIEAWEGKAESTPKDDGVPF